MPYLTCSSCGLPTYCVSEGTCPACGTLLRRSNPPVGPHPTAVHEVDAKLQMACRELKTDAALLTEIRGGREHIRFAAGRNWAGRSFPLRDTICERLLSGAIGSVVADTHAEPALKGVALGDVGAYIGVQFKSADARAYVLCCLAHEARHDLGEADVRFLAGLAESLRPVLGS
jgi:hypothetical protein